MAEKLRILMLEDVPVDAELVEHELHNIGVRFALKRVETKNSFVKEFTEFKPHIILADYSLPAFDGISALEIVRNHDSDIPFIFVSGSIGEEKATETLRMGATDFVLKEKLSRLAPVVQRALHEVEEKNKRRKAEELIKSIFETIREGLIVIDPEYKILSANRAYCEQIKRPINDIIGRNCYKVAHRLDRPCFESGIECPVKHTLETGEIFTTIHNHYNKEKTPINLEIKSYPMKDAKGNIISVIETVNDITERAALENQLRHAQKLKGIGQLAGGIAHDFNNILTAIIGYGNLLMTRLGGDEQSSRYLEDILAASERAVQLTQGLLAFSRKQIINPRAVNINEIVRSIERLLSRIIGEDVELKTILSPKDVIAMVDTGQMEQVIMNLCTNARDAMPDGGILTIETETIEMDSEYIKRHGYGKKGKYVLLSVSDTGAGMDEKTKERIFEPFFTTKEVGKGTGLGLAMVYGIVRQHDGYINVYSEPKRGTTFKIYLPLIKAEAKEAKAAGAAPPCGGTEVILLAEDDAGVRMLMKEVLEKFGYSVIEAVDGEDAVKKFKENKDRIQLLILDVIMPKKNGKQVYDEIMELKPGAKVIFSSGYTANIIQKKGILEEGIDFILKPVSPQELLRKVREVLNK
jgi:PAS domain S-box-containing protein